MRRQLLCSGYPLVGMAFLSGLIACSNKSSPPGAKPDAGVMTDAGTKDSGRPDSSTPVTDASVPVTDAGCMPTVSTDTYVLIDDMETTTHGPIEFSTGIALPLSSGYWYNSGANYLPDAGVTEGADMSTPPQGSFVFSALPTPTTTLNCAVSSHAARQSCALNGLYDTCGVGFEFAQQPDGDAGVAMPSDAGSAMPSDAGDAGDAGLSIPKTSIPFDISRYKAITFWGKTTTPDPATGSLQVKVQFPDTDTDPRGEVCNGGGGNTSQCYNSYAQLLSFTTTWQRFTVVLDAGDAGVAPAGGIAIDPSWGFQQAQWIPTKVYGINWQAQRNTDPDAGPPLMTDVWVDDVYFIE